MAGLIAGSSGAGSFWSKPEGKFGMFVTAGLTGLFGYVLYRIMPGLLALAHQTFFFSLYCIAIAALFYVTVLDSSLRNLLLNFYKRFIEALYILSFKIDPTGGLMVRLREKKEELNQAKAEAGTVKAQAEAIGDTMRQNQKTIDEGLKRMKVARSQGKVDDAQAEAIIVGVAKAANEELGQVKARIDGYYVQILEIIHKAELAVRVLDGVIQVKTRTFNAAKASRSSLKKAMGVLLGNTKKDDVFDANVAWIDDYASTAFGEMDAIMDLAKPALDSINLQQGVYSLDAFQLLEDRLHTSKQTLENDPRGQKLLEASNDPMVMTQIATAKSAVPVAVAVPESNDFARVFSTRAKQK